MQPLLNFFETPRAMGNPFQEIAHSKEDIIQFIKDNDDKNPVFISHNSYPTFQGRDPYQSIVNKLFIDLDSKKVENAHIDIRKVDQFLDDECIPRYDAFSGSKGFHCYPILKPQTYVISEYLKDATRAIQLWLRTKLSLRTLDIVSAEPKRLCRMWYTKHSSLNKTTGKQFQNGNYCCPLLPEWIHTWDTQEIINYSKSPTILDYNPLQHMDWKAHYLTLDEFIEHFSIDIEDIIQKNSESCDSEGTIMPYKPVTDEFIKKILPRPCIHSQIVHNNNPPHSVRFAATVQLKSLRYDRKWIFDFFQARNYMDKHRTETCAYQINHIFDHNPPYKHPTCDTLYKQGLCIGKECSKYWR